MTREATVLFLKKLILMLTEECSRKIVARKYFKKADL